MLTQIAEKVKAWIRANQGDLFTAAVVFLIGMAGFGLGRLSVSLPEKQPIMLEDPAGGSDRPSLTTSAPVTSMSDLNNGAFVGSKSGSIYYAVWCPGASRIREENKVRFKTQEDAKAKGYRPAKNCSGL